MELSIQIPSRNIPSYIIHYYPDNEEEFKKLDCFYARMLLHIEFFLQFVLENDNSGSHAPSSSDKISRGMSKNDIYQLIQDMTHNKKRYSFIKDLKNIYQKYGFLIFIDDYKNVIVYTEDKTLFDKWLNENYKSDVSSEDVYEHSYLLI